MITLNEKQKQLHEAIENKDYLRVIMDRRDGMTTGLLTYAIDKLSNIAPYNVLYLVRSTALVYTIHTCILPILPAEASIVSEFEIEFPSSVKTTNKLFLHSAANLESFVKAKRFDLTIVDVDVLDPNDFDFIQTRKLVLASTVEPLNFVNLASSYSEAKEKFFQQTGVNT